MDLKILVTHPKITNPALENVDSPCKGHCKHQWKPIQVALEKLIVF